MAGGGSTTAKGGGLGRKVGPLPLYAWVLLASAVLGYFLFIRKPSAAAAQAATTNASQADTTGMPGAATSAGSPQDAGQATADLLAAYGQQNDSWIQAFLHQSDTIASLAGQQINWATTGGGGSGVPAPSSGTTNSGGTSTSGGGYYDPNTGMNTSPTPVPIDRIIPSPPSGINSPTFGTVGTGYGTSPSVPFVFSNTPLPVLGVPHYGGLAAP